ncbi:MAG: glycerophosphoryl diester phosphodiesterase membrane domain-containing protein [Trueperella pyogenes]|nr:glycerophosphoryl diester phosphodiesterase membrane domain-containing protein [Trueperella pyogenes]
MRGTIFGKTRVTYIGVIMSDPQGAPTNDPWAPQSSSSQNPSQGSVPSTPQVPQTPQAQQPWGAPEQPAQPQQAQQPWGAPEQPAQPQQAQQPWGAPEQPAQPQQQWGAAPQPDAAWQGTQTQGGTAWTVAQPGIIPLRPLTVGELFNGAFQAVRVNPQTMFGFAFAIMAVVGLVQAFFASSSTSSLTRALSSGDANDLVYSLGNSMGSFVTSGLTLLATAFLSGMLALTVWDAVLGRKSSPADAWHRFSPRFVPVLLATFLIGIIEFVAIVVILLVFMIPFVLVVVNAASARSYDSASAGIGGAFAIIFLMIVALIVIACFLTVKFAFTSSAVVLEGLGPVDAMKRSWSLSKGSFWRILGRIWLIGIVTGLISAVLGGIVGAILGVGAAAADSVGMLVAFSAFLSALLSAVVIPVQSSFYTLMYLDERMRKENLAPMIAQEASRA